MEQDHLSAHFQPIVDLAGGDAVGFEALLRWRRDGHVHDAAEFIELADHSGLILEIGDNARNEVWGLAADARTRTGRHDHVWFLNVSPVELVAPGFVASLTRLLETHDLPASAFVIEVPAEPRLLGQRDVEWAVHELRGAGLRVALDHVDVASPLDLLWSLPVALVKISPAFTRGITAEATSRRISAVLDRAADTGVVAIVEGIEGADQLDAAVALGASYGQGRHFAGPAPLAELLPWLETGHDLAMGCGSLRR